MPKYLSYGSYRLRCFIAVLLILVVALITMCCQGPAGTGVTGASVDDSGNLSFMLSDGQTIDAGNIEGPQGVQGVQGPQGSEGPSGPKGDIGISIAGASIDSFGDLILTLTNGDTVDAGHVVGAQGPEGEPGSQAANTFIDIIPQIEPTVVRVDTDIASGSGIVIRSSGYVITNQHVIDQASSVQVTFMNEDMIDATIVTSDPNLDLALLKLDSDRTDYPFAVIGSSDDIEVGASVLTAGYPLGTDLPGPATFTQGIISAFRFDSIVDITYIQMDAPISAGNSGGGLFNSDGKLVGIPSYGFDEPTVDAEDLNLAIPMEALVPFVENAVGSS